MEHLLTLIATDESRFDHDPATGESLGLLIEEERTNFRFNPKRNKMINSTENVVTPRGITETVRRLGRDPR